MSYSRPAPREAISAVIRSRYPQIHSNSCRCTPQSRSELEFLKKENTLLRSRRYEESGEREQKMMMEDRLRVVSLENEKLHERLMNYQVTLEELEKTHLELVQMMRSEHRMKLEEGRGNGREQRIRTEERSPERRDRSYEVQDCEIQQSLQGQYIVSLKKVKSKQPQLQHSTLKEPASTSRKPGIKLSYQGGSIKKSHFATESPRQNPTNPQNLPPLSSSHHKPPAPNISQFKQKLHQNQLLQLSQKIQFLQTLIQQKDDQFTKQKSNNKTLQNQNQLLKLRLKNVEQNVKSYEESIHHYQGEAIRLKKLVEEIKTRETTDTFALKQNQSMKESNEYLKRQIEDLESEHQKEKSHIRSLKQELEGEKRKNLRLSLDSKELDVVTLQLQKLRRLNQELTHQLNSKQTQLTQSHYHKHHSNDTISRQLLDIRRVLQNIDLTSIEQEEYRNVIEWKTKCVEMNHEISSLTGEIQRLKQKILLMEQKEMILVSDKEMLVMKVEAVRRENAVLVEQIEALERSIERYLEEEPMPSLKVSVSEGRDMRNQGLEQVKGSIGEIVRRLKGLQQKLARTGQ